MFGGDEEPILPADLPVPPLVAVPPVPPERLVANRVAVGNFVVPGEYLEVEIEGDPPEQKQVLEVWLTGRGREYLWLERALKLGGRFFLDIEWKVTLEIRELLRTRRAQQGPRTSRQPRLGVYLNVRGKRLLVRNSLARVSLLLEPGEAVPTITWLLEQFVEQLEDLGGAQALARERKRRREDKAKARDPSRSSGALGSDGVEGENVPPEVLFEACEDRVRKEVIDDLKARERIENVWWSQTKLSLVIVAHWPIGLEGTYCKQKTFAIWNYKRKKAKILESLEEPGRTMDEKRTRAIEQLHSLWANASNRVLYDLQRRVPEDPRDHDGVVDMDEEDDPPSPASSSSGASVSAVKVVSAEH